MNYLFVEKGVIILVGFMEWSGAGVYYKNEYGRCGVRIK
jgi:hypothetical protein